MTVRCKFVCDKVTKMRVVSPAAITNINQPGGALVVPSTRFAYEAEFRAVYGGSPENDAFFAATPNGLLRVGMYEEDLFVPGAEYYLDIIPARTREG